MKSMILMMLAVMPVLGQSSTATLTGQVEDPAGAAVMGAQVVLRDPARGWERTVMANATGGFVFSPVGAGTYEVEVSVAGFQKARLTGIVLNADDSRSVRVKLALAARDEAIVVTADAPLVRESPAVATSVDRRFIENQPLNGRSFQGLIQLAPGVTVTPANLVSQGQFSVNGQRPGANHFSVDGVSANFGLPAATSPYEGAGGSVPSFTAQGGTSSLASVDAVQEFTIQTSTYAPEYGRQPGAQVAIVTRSGTNAYHGTAFHYFRNDKLDANSWFGNYNRIGRPALRQNDFGFTVGGPVAIPKLYEGKNKTFFFGSYEGLRLRQPVVLSGARVPSMAARQAATGAVKTLLEAYPLPVGEAIAGTPAETPYAAGFSNPSTLNATSVRVDHNVSTRLMLFGRFNHAPSEGKERARFATASFVARIPNETQTTTVGATMVMSPRLTNDLRFNYSRSMAGQIYEQDTFGGAKVLPNELLFPSFADPAKSLYYLTIGGSDENTISPGTFSRNVQRQMNVVDTMQWNRGGHAVKFGFDYRRLAPTIGGREYGKTLTVPTITQLTTGIVPTGTVTQIANFLEPRYVNFSGYGQDAWKVTPRLTLTYGLRWDVNPAPGNTPARTVTGIENPSAAVLAAEGTKYYKTGWKNFAPRLGVAYQPFRERGTVVRAGIGTFYDLGYTLLGTALSPTLFPFARSRTVSNTGIQDPVFFAAVPPLNMNPPYPRLFAYYGDYEAPRTHQVSVAVEQPLGAANAVSVTYVGALGRKLGRVESLLPAVLRNANFTRIDAVSSTASSDYHALQVQYKRRMTRGVQALGAYTWGKSLDTSSDESNANFLPPVNRYAAVTDRGPSSFDIRQTFSGSLTWELPAPESGIGKAVLGGFAMDAIVRMRTAPPVLVVTGRDALGLGITSVSRPDVVAGRPLYLESAGYPGGRVINRDAFDATTPQAQGRQGTLGRNVLRGFGLRQGDVSLRRRFALGESVTLDFRADAFNVTNTANFGNPTGVLTSANFGRSVAILATGVTGGQNPQFQIGGPRSVQLGIRLGF